MRFNLLGAKIHVTFLFCFVICVAVLFDKTGLIVPSLLAAAIHEFGHLFVLWVSDCPPEKIELIPAGVRITKKVFEKNKNVYITSLSGPLLNLVSAFCAGLNYCLYKRTYVLDFAVCNAALGVFNLLPACGLDGGVALYNFLLRRHTQYAAANTLRIITVALGVAAGAAGVYLYTSKRLNISVFFVALYLLFSALCFKKE